MTNNGIELDWIPDLPQVLGKLKRLLYVIMINIEYSIKGDMHYE